MPRPSLSAVIPAYNEQHRLERTVRAALLCFRGQDRRFDITVVDDGSRDQTGQVVRRLAAECPEVRLIRLAANRGKGYAVRTGVLNSQGDLVLFADADGATPFEEIDRLEAALQGGYDIAIGSRALGGEDVRVTARPLRIVMGRAFHALVSALTVKGFRDTQCGFKLFRGMVAQDLFSRMRINGFSFDVEVLLMAQRQGYRVAEVPVNWVHQPGSKVHLVKDSLKMARDLFRMRAAALRGEYDQPHVARLTPVESSHVVTEASP